MINKISDNLLIISVIGPHAGESEEDIFARKINDIEKSDQTYWLIKSWKAKPDMLQSICSHAIEKGYNIKCFFIEPSSIGGATPTKVSNSAKYYSTDNITWSVFPKDLSPVTGKIDGNSYALVFNELKLENGILDLWDYADYFSQSSPLKIMQGASTLCAIKKDSSNIPILEKIKSRFRRVIAVGKLCPPYGVWLK